MMLIFCLNKYIFKHTITSMMSMHDDSNVLRHNSLLLSKNMLTKQLHCLVQSHGATNKEKIFKKNRKLYQAS